MSESLSRTTWQEKIVYFHLRGGTGLSRTLDTSERASKMIRMFHTTMIVPILILLSLEMCGMVSHLCSSPISLQKVILTLNFGWLFFGNFVVQYIFLVRQFRYIVCLHNISDPDLYCYGDRVKGFMLYKNKITDSFLVCMLVFMYSLGIFNGIVSPILRFGLDFDDWFIVIPMWYPIDVTSSRRVFWFVLLFETVIIWYLSFVFATVGVLYMHTILSIRAEFETLNQYLENDGRGHSSQTQEPLFKTSEEGWKPKTIFDLGMFNNTGFSDDFDGNCSHLKRVIQDWQTLRGHAKLTGEIFAVYYTAAYVLGAATITIMAYAVIYTIRTTESMGKMISETAMYFSWMVGTTGHLGLLSLTTNLFQNTYDDTRITLGEGNWHEKSMKYKKIFLSFTLALNRSFQMKALTFVPVDLRQFSNIISRSFTNFRFLYELPTSKYS
ncbi:unnamed protein product [Bemisia tabaci]|uniref:Odorant receptor n=1 Tax=Bemisia tabaci TaxID=7038 RepID=A0A9P0F0R9_BEMTA|nr:unnamed protein product [Bemisia tabaci]